MIKEGMEYYDAINRNQPFEYQEYDIDEMVGSNKVNPDVHNFIPETGEIPVISKTPIDSHFIESLESAKLGKAYRNRSIELDMLQQSKCLTFANTECEKHYLKYCNLCSGSADIDKQIKAVRKKLNGIRYLFSLIRAREDYGTCDPSVIADALRDASQRAKYLRELESYKTGYTHNEVYGQQAEVEVVDRTDYRLHPDDSTSQGAISRRGRREERVNEVVDSLLEQNLPFTVNTSEVEEVIDERREAYLNRHKRDDKTYSQYVKGRMGRKTFSDDGYYASRNREILRNRLKAKMEKNLAQLDRNLEAGNLAQAGRTVEGVRIVKKVK